MEQTLRLYKNLDQLLILTFWEIIKTNNVLLLDLDYSESKEYSESDKAAIELLWSALYDENYNQKANSSAIMAMDKANDAIMLLRRINLLSNNLNALVRLYENKTAIDAVYDDRFIQLEQSILRNFVNIDKRITPKYFDGLEANHKLVSRFINSMQTTYDINHKRVEQTVAKEVKNVFETIAVVSSILGMQLTAYTMTVSEWNAYEKIALEKQTAKSENHGQ